MRFAYSRPLDSTPADALAWCDQAHRHGLTPHALVDGSMFETWELDSLSRQGMSLEPALADSPFAAYQQAGPLVWPIHEGAGPAVRRLITKASGRPALSFIRARQGAADLRPVLVWLAAAHTDDDQVLHCRFADTRTLPCLLDTLQPDQAGHLAGAIADWAWIGRDGTLQSRAFEAPARAEAPEADALRLDTRQFQHIMEAAEPDMVFQMLASHSPELLPDPATHRIHTRLSALVAAARQRGIADLPDLLDYSTIGLLTYDGFDQHPAVQETWQALARGPARFGDLAAQWPEPLWQALEDAAAGRLQKQPRQGGDAHA